MALEALALRLQPELRLAASLVLVLGGTAVCLLSWFSWYRTEQTLRLSQPLPSSLLAVPIALATTVAGLLVTAAVLLR